MKPLWKREYKKLGIRAARVPQTDSCVSGVVMISDREGRGYCYIRFNPALEDAVGRALFFGISQAHPAFLHLVCNPTTNKWYLSVRYLDRSSNILLVEYPEMPKWVKNIRRGTDE